MRRVGVALFALAALFAFAPRALAASGSATDPDDTAKKLDIATLSHDDTDSTITYKVTFQNDWQPSDTPYYGVVWLLETTGDGKFNDGCLVVTDQGNGPADFVLIKGDCNGALNNANILLTGAATTGHDSGHGTITVSYPRNRLSELGLTGNSYQYFVETHQDDSTAVVDRAPDTGGVTHTLDCAGPGVISVTPTAAVAGQPVTVTGDCWKRNADLSVKLLSTPVNLGTAHTDAAGKFSMQVTIPANTTAGTHQIVVTGTSSDGTTASPSATISVQRALPVTGSATSRRGLLAVATILLGIALVMAAAYERRLVSLGATRAQMVLDRLEDL